MGSNQHNFLLPTDYQGCGARFLNTTPDTSFGGMVLPPLFKPMRPLHGVEVQPSEACPKNFIIFDQTDDRSKIMYHPANVFRTQYPGFIFDAPPVRDIEKNIAYSEDEEVSSYQIDDSQDIDALLSSETEDNEETDEEEESMTWTEGNCGNNSLDSISCLNYGSHPKQCRLPCFRKSSVGGSSCSGRKRQKMRKMVKILRGIVPGAGQMNTAAVLDETVRYLKSLKVEEQKLGVENLKSYI